MSPQFDFTETRPTPARSKTPKSRPITPGALPPIEEKDAEVDARVKPVAEELSSNKSQTGPPGSDGKERFMFTPLGGERATERELVMDKFGFPLLPQPLDDPQDPLTWTRAVKIRILIQISLLSSLSLFTAYAIVSAQWY